MDFITNSPGESLITLGIVLLIIEVAVMGFATFVLTFLGLSAVVTGVLVYLGVLPSDLLTIVISNAVVASIFAAILWKPLKKFQNRQDTHTINNDLIGMDFVLTQAIGPSKTTTHRLSGIEWTIKSHVDIQANTQVAVEKAEVGILWIRPLAQ